MSLSPAVTDANPACFQAGFAALRRPGAIVGPFPRVATVSAVPFACLLYTSLGLVLLFVPGIDVLTMDEYVESVSWNILLLIGCVQSLASGMQQQGAAKWLLDATIGKLGIGAGALTLSSAFLVPVIRWFLPVGPALIAITLPPLCLLGMDVGVTPVFFAVICLSLIHI